MMEDLIDNVLQDL